MYPITRQLIEYEKENKEKKIGMLILDVKGNYHEYVRNVLGINNRLNDLEVIELNGKIKYNPLDKPDLKPSIIANRIKTILELFSGNNSESYWIEKAEQAITESIKLCRSYNENYVTFEEIHKLIIDENYYNQIIKKIKNKFETGVFTKAECYEISSAIEFFKNEYFKLDSRTIGILKSEITRITNSFISDYNVKEVFNPKKNEKNICNLKSILKEGKIIVLNMNIAEYKNLSKIIAAYLKLDFQSEVLAQLANKNKPIRTVAFISDEYHEYITENDSDFFAQSREAKCINIVATQSYSSLLKNLKSETELKVIIQNLINKIWFRTDDIYTIEEAQKQIGKTEKEKISRSISENAKETKYSYISKAFKSVDSNLSESINKTFEKDYIFDINYFTQKLKTFSGIAFLSDGNKILNPEIIDLIPYFYEEDDNYKKNNKK